MKPAHLALACCLTLAAGPAHARDYDLDPDRWNGLGYLVTTADEARVTLDTSNAIDLGALEPDDVLVILYPTSNLPVDDLLAFVASGGYLILADDQGTSAALLDKVGIRRRDAGPTGHLAFWDQQEGFPILRPAGTHFLFYNVQQVVANYPAALRIPESAGNLHPILSFEGGREHFAVEAELGGGKLLAIADPSIYLNDMLRRFYGDKQFAANSLRLYCQREPCTATLVRPGATFSGTFDSERARLGGLPKEVRARIEELNEALGLFSHEVAEPPYAVIVAAAIAALLLLYAARLRGRERIGVMGLLPSVPSQVSSPALDDARGLVAQRGEADFSHLAQTLGEHALERARRADLAAWVRAPHDSPVGEGARDQLRAALLRVEAETASLRSRQPPIWSADRFLRLHDDVQVLLRNTPDAGRRRAGPRQGEGGRSAPPRG